MRHRSLGELDDGAISGGPAKASAPSHLGCDRSSHPSGDFAACLYRLREWPGCPTRYHVVDDRLCNQHLIDSGADHGDHAEADDDSRPLAHHAAIVIPRPHRSEHGSVVAGGRRSRSHRPRWVVAAAHPPRRPRCGGGHRALAGIVPVLAAQHADRPSDRSAAPPPAGSTGPTGGLVGEHCGAATRRSSPCRRSRNANRCLAWSSTSG
jgi:hypothetical protein